MTKLRELLKAHPKKSMAILGLLTLHFWGKYERKNARPYTYVADSLPKFGQGSLTSPVTTQAKLKKGIIRIYTISKDSKEEGECSGSVVDDHYVLTAAHCLDPKLKYKIYDSEGNSATGKTAGYIARIDVGLIVGDFSKFHKVYVDFSHSWFAAMEEARQMSVDSQGQVVPLEVALCGYPLIQKRLVCNPYIGLPHPSSFYYAGYTTGTPGMSGGPAVLADGKNLIVIGVVSGSGLEEYETSHLTYFAPTLGLLGGLEIEP